MTTIVTPTQTAQGTPRAASTVPSSEQVAEWRELAEKATVGPWCVSETPNFYWVDHSNGGVTGIVRFNDGLLIAAARSAVPVLCDAVEALRSRVAELESAASKTHNCIMQLNRDGDTSMPHAHIITRLLIADSDLFALLENIDDNTELKRVKAENAALKAELQALRGESGLVTAMTHEEKVFEAMEGRR